MPEDTRIDDYIEAAAGFAKPILCHFRQTIHGAAHVSETIKWSMPFFEYRGRPIAMMAAFKAHAGIGIFDGTPMAGGDSMGQFGKLTKVADLPEKAALIANIRTAVELIDQGGLPKRSTSVKPSLAVPDDLRAALDAVPAAATAFAGFPPGAQREYIEWALEAKQATTRARRIETTVAQCAEGKRRYWNMAGR
jgi:uncharacterized protein YdeI (YjbR/CyaY-like superfamily)